MARCGQGRNIGLRRHAISKIFAWSLVTLSLLPFSAPFKTIDLAGSQSSHSHDSLPKDKLDSDEHVLSTADESFAPPHLMFVAVAPFVRSSQLEERPFSPLVLRL